MRSLFILALCLLFAAAAVSAQQSPVTGYDVRAQTSSRDVVIRPDGTWDWVEREQGDTERVILQSGEALLLDLKPGKDGKKRWRRDKAGAGGFIQIVIARALDLEADDGLRTPRACMPVVAVRNLAPSTVRRIVVEITYIKDEHTAHSSTLHREMDRGEYDERILEPLTINGCSDAIGRVTVPLCLFANGADCRHTVLASAHGTIPLTMSSEAMEPTPAPGRRE